MFKWSLVPDFSTHMREVITVKGTPKKTETENIGIQTYF